MRYVKAARSEEIGVRSKEQGVRSKEQGARNSSITPSLLAPRSSLKNGFTLLEVLVAMSIIATALVALLSLQSRSIKMVESAEMYEGARMLAERLMGEGELKGVSGSESNGVEGPYKWVLTEMRITPENMPEGVQALPGRQLSLDISWKEGKREEKLNFAEYIYER